MLKRCRACNSKNVVLNKIINKIPLNIWPQKKIFKNNYKPLKIYICKNCGQIQTQTLNQKSIKKIYTGNTYNFNNYTQVKSRINTLQKKYNFKNKNLLDIGGGTNPLLKYINNANRWVSDFKINEELKKNNISLIEGDFLKKKINEKFDYIFLFHTLEHLENTNLYLKKIYKLLNENGRLIIEVPNAEFDLDYSPYYIFFHMHITVYYKATLINLLKISGFEKDKSFNTHDVLFFSFKKRRYKISSTKTNFYLKSKMFTKKFSDTIKKIDKYFTSENIKNIGIFGAGGSSNLLLNNSIYLNKNVNIILDNDVKKENLYLFNNKVSIFKPTNKILEKLSFLIILNENHKFLIPQKYRKKIINIQDIINEK